MYMSIYIYVLDSEGRPQDVARGDPMPAECSSVSSLDHRKYVSCPGGSPERW